MSKVIIALNKKTETKEFSQQSVLFSTDGTNADEKIQNNFKIPTFRNLETEASIPGEKTSPLIVDSSEVKTCFDVNALFGPISFSDFLFSTSYSLELKIKTSKIKTKTEFVVKENEIINISSLQHSKLGIMKIPAGVASVWLNGKNWKGKFFKTKIKW